MHDRLVKLCVACSLDGYIAGPNEEVDWLHDPEDFDMGAFLASVDTLVMGRKTYDFLMRMGQGVSKERKAYVFTRSDTPPDHPGVEFVRGDVGGFVARLREQPGRDLWLMGGGELTHAFLAADMVDEIVLGVHPIVLGAGIPLFPGEHERRAYELQSAKTYVRGLVGLTYRRAGRAGPHRPGKPDVPAPEAP